MSRPLLGAQQEMKVKSRFTLVVYFCSVKLSATEQEYFLYALNTLNCTFKNEYIYWLVKMLSALLLLLNLTELLNKDPKVLVQ